MASIRDAVLHMAARAGMMMLRYGAETYRAEETISRICAAYGYESEPFALPTGVFAGISSGDQPVSILLRIKTRTLHLNRVDALNTFAREVEQTRPPVDFHPEGTLPVF